MEINCKSRAKTVNGVLEGVKQHNHQKKVSKVVELEHRNEVISQQRPFEKASKIYEKATDLVRKKYSNQHTDLTGSAMQSFQSLESTIYRNKLKRLPPLPGSLQDINIPEV